MRDAAGRPDILMYAPPTTNTTITITTTTITTTSTPPPRFISSLHLLALSYLSCSLWPRHRLFTRPHPIVQAVRRGGVDSLLAWHRA